MRLRRYCVALTDNWTPFRLFLTLEGAKRFYLPRRAYANVFRWQDGEWRWMFGARDSQEG